MRDADKNASAAVCELLARMQRRRGDRPFTILYIYFEAFIQSVSQRDRPPARLKGNVHALTLLCSAPSICDAPYSPFFLIKCINEFTLRLVYFRFSSSLVLKVGFGGSKRSLKGSRAKQSMIQSIENETQQQGFQILSLKKNPKKNSNQLVDPGTKPYPRTLM